MPTLASWIQQSLLLSSRQAGLKCADCIFHGCGSTKANFTNLIKSAGGRGFAGRAALGKMEYHVPSFAALTSLQDFAFSQLCNVPHFELPDQALKCAIWSLTCVPFMIAMLWILKLPRCVARTPQACGANRQPRSLPSRLLSSNFARMILSR